MASKALDWLEMNHNLPRFTATILGEYLWGTGRNHHVLREHTFADENFFFRFAGDEQRLDRADLHDVQRDMHGSRGLTISSRSYLGKTYPQTFVESDAVD